VAWELAVQRIINDADDIAQVRSNYLLFLIIPPRSIILLVSYIFGIELLGQGTWRGSKREISLKNGR
jgi:3-phenylpropionate/cinnamic acid dioxygenase small subunit